MIDLFNYARRKSVEVQVGALAMGGKKPIRIQSMTNTVTMDTKACVEQAKRIIGAGGEYVRLTTQGVKEAENLKEINIALRTQGYMTPLIADVHFNANVADVAALYAEKVRINPGNYVDAARTFKQLEYTDEEYAQELQKIRARFIPFLNICKEQCTAIRIGVNHGSLSDRIMSRYGDTPEGMVESCMEFLRICKDEQFDNVVISIKASNTVVMVNTVRLLVAVMPSEGMHYPLHLGVTEAGDGEDGRIKSALGIGALLADGIGDTIRVSLSEAPEAEIPVARKLVQHVLTRSDAPYIPGELARSFDYLHPQRRHTFAIKNIGNHQPPVVISFHDENASAPSPQFMPDYIYCGATLPSQRYQTAYIVDAAGWQDEEGVWPAFNFNTLGDIETNPASLKFLFIPYLLLEQALDVLKAHPEVVVISQGVSANRLGEHRALVHQLMNAGIDNPVVIFQHYGETNLEDFQIKSAADMGALVFDGVVDGLFLLNQNSILSTDAIEQTSFGILQAGRLCTTKTEYISCPGCGRTLFDLQSTIARVKQATSHLRGLKIGIMGCIVNGPGEMADADYGYVGAGRGKVSLYRRRECVEKNIPEAEAVEKLVNLIKSNGDWKA